MSGPNARYGSFSMRGAQLAVKEINDAGGVNGRKIELVSGDSQGTPVEGVSATRRLIDSDKVDYISVTSPVPSPSLCSPLRRTLVFFSSMRPPKTPKSPMGLV